MPVKTGPPDTRRVFARRGATAGSGTAPAPTPRLLLNAPFTLA